MNRLASICTGFLSLQIFVLLWLALSRHTYMVQIGLFWAAFFVGGVVSLFALVAAFKRSEHRTVYLFLVGGFCCAILLVPWSLNRHAKRGERWFLREGVTIFEALVQQVVRNPERLNELRTQVTLEGFGGVTFAKTNSDGSITVEFYLPEGTRRHGYVFHSKSKLPVESLSAIPDLKPLTNGWYRF